MKNLELQHKILIGIIVVLILTIIASQTFNNQTDKKLIKEVEKIVKTIEKEEPAKAGSLIYKINNNLTLDKKIILNNVDGKGMAYYDNDKAITVVLEKYNKCAIKTSDMKEATVLNEKCGKYDMFQGAKVILGAASPLQKVGNEYIYRGNNAKNYIVYDNEYWRILSFSDQGIKIVSEYSMNNMAYSNTDNNFETSDINKFLNNEYSSIQPNILKTNWNIGESTGDKRKNVKKNTQTKTINEKIGTLTLADYLYSIDGECEIKDTSITCTRDTFIRSNNDLWLATAYQGNNYQAWAVNTNNNLYVDDVKNIKDIRPVIILDKKYKVINGEGTKENPYILTILSE